MKSEDEHFIELSFRAMGFRKIPTEIYTMSQLKILVFSGNEKLEGELKLSGFPELTKLSVSDTRLSKLNELKACIQLTDLFIYNSSISELPGLDKLQNLERLEAQNSGLRSLQGLDKLPNLRRVDVRGCPIDQVKDAAIIANLKARRNLIFVI